MSRPKEAGHDSSVTIGDNAQISGSALGKRASVTTTSTRRTATLLAVVGAIIVGWVTNLIYDWTAYVFHFFGQK